VKIWSSTRRGGQGAPAPCGCRGLARRGSCNTLCDSDPVTKPADGRRFHPGGNWFRMFVACEGLAGLGRRCLPGRDRDVPEGIVTFRGTAHRSLHLRAASPAATSKTPSRRRHNLDVSSRNGPGPCASRVSMLRRQCSDHRSSRSIKKSRWPQQTRRRRDSISAAGHSISVTHDSIRTAGHSVSVAGDSDRVAGDWM